MQNMLKILFIGAHPDDGDIQFGGTAIRYLELGHTVTYLSMTNGNAGHQTLDKITLAKRRYKETQAVANFLGLTYLVLDNNDGELEPTLKNRLELIKTIREIKPDIIVTHRSNDYHADHRNTSLLVQDAAYLVAVPLICPEIPPLTSNPVILFHQDSFSKPNPFTPHIFVDITKVFDRKMEALALHESQVFEWLPFIEGYLNDVPKEKKARLGWLKKQRFHNPRNVNRFKPLLKKLISQNEFENISYIEAFEVSEYGGEVSQENFNKLFPFAISNLA